MTDPLPEADFFFTNTSMGPLIFQSWLIKTEKAVLLMRLNRLIVKLSQCCDTCKSY